MHSSAVVLFDSNGGLLLPGLEIGKAIRLKGFATVVPDAFQCASACALAWLAGTPRLLSPNGRVGFHAAHLEENGKLMPTATGNALVGAYLNQLNLPTSAVVYMVSSALTADNRRPSRESPGHFIFTEIFASQADFEAHNRTPHVQSWFARLPELADGGVTVIRMGVLGNTASGR